MMALSLMSTSYAAGASLTVPTRFPNKPIRLILLLLTLWMEKLSQRKIKFPSISLGRTELQLGFL